MKRQLRFVGLGGQGVILAGEILAAAKIQAGGYGVKASSYSSQVRGGATKVDILLDDEVINYPYANEGEIEFMLATAQKSFDLFKSGVKEGGIIVIESNLVQASEEDKKKYKIFAFPIIAKAKDEIGNILTQSVIALGLALAFTKLLDEKIVEERMLASVPKKFQELNKKAFQLGLREGKILASQAKN